MMTIAMVYLTKLLSPDQYWSGLFHEKKFGIAARLRDYIRRKQE